MLKRILPAICLFLALAFNAAWLLYNPAPKPRAGEAGAAPAAVLQVTSSGLTVTTSSAATWRKALIVDQASSTSWHVVIAEHGSGDEGGIYPYTVTITPGGGNGPIPGPTPPVPPGPTPLPPPDSSLDTLSKSATTAVAAAGLGGTEAQAVAAVYAGLADRIDAGEIRSSDQLRLAVDTRMADTLNETRKKAWGPALGTLAAWLNAQQDAGKLSDATMPRYAAAFRAFAAGVSPLLAPAVIPNGGPIVKPSDVAPGSRCRDRPHGWK